MNMKLKAMKLATALLKGSIRLVGKGNSSMVRAYLAEEMAPVWTESTDSGPIHFFCAGALAAARARSLLTKEPETIEWIRSFQPADVLWDIGANVGVYSLYAASRGSSVVAFEPAAANYYALCRNIEINKLENLISAFCIAFSDCVQIDSLYMRDTKIGSALHSFGEALPADGTPMNPSSSQSALGFTIDAFVEQFRPPFPAHIKIDVDGIESRIVKGAVRTLSDPRLRSVLLELTPGREADYDSIVAALESAGLCCLRKGRDPGTGPKSSVVNHIFVRHHLVLPRPGAGPA